MVVVHNPSFCKKEQEMKTNQKMGGYKYVSEESGGGTKVLLLMRKKQTCDYYSRLPQDKRRKNLWKSKFGLSAMCVQHPSLGQGGSTTLQI